MGPWSPLAKYRPPCRTTMESLCVDVARSIRVPIFICTLSLQYFPLPKEDYLLGLSDLTGELMRFAISGFSRKGGRARAMQVCKFVRDCKSGMYFLPSTYCPGLTGHQDFDRFTPFVKGLRKKQVVTNQSLEKIENGIWPHLFSLRGHIEIVVQPCTRLWSEPLNMICHRKYLMISSSSQCPTMRTRRSGAIEMLVVMMNTNMIIEGIELLTRSAYPSSYSHHEDPTFNIVHSVLPRCIIILYILSKESPCRRIVRPYDA